VAAEKAPSPVKTCAELTRWCQGGDAGSLKPVQRERLRLSLELLAGMVRDLVALKTGALGCHLLNQDMEMDLRSATGYYGRAGLFMAGRRIAEASADIMGYVDQSLAVERVFRAIREIRE